MTCCRLELPVDRKVMFYYCTLSFIETVREAYCQRQNQYSSSTELKHRPAHSRLNNKICPTFSSAFPSNVRFMCMCFDIKRAAYKILHLGGGKFPLGKFPLPAVIFYTRQLFRESTEPAAYPKTAVGGRTCIYIF